METMDYKILGFENDEDATSMVLVTKVLSKQLMTSWWRFSVNQHTQ